MGARIEAAARGILGVLLGTSPLRITVADWWTIYETTYTVRKRAPRLDRQMMAHALPFFGSMPIADVRKSDCVRYLSQRRNAMTANPSWKTQRPVSEGTILRERSFLQSVFQQAIEDGYLERNPWRSIERKAYAVRDRVLELDEQAALLSVLSPRFQRFVLFMLGTGLRLDEARGIDPMRDVDWRGRLITVYDHVDATGALTTRVKFGKSRTIPILPEVEPVLREQIHAERRLWPQNQQRLREVVCDGARKAGIPPVSPHTFRHTFGHRWILAGYDIYQLSKILGHASVAVTERHYAHLRKQELVKVTAHVRLGLEPAGVVRRHSSVLSGPWSSAVDR